MAQLMVIYKTPKDPAAFDAYYFGTHVPLAHTIKQVKRYEVSAGPVASPAGESGVYLVAILYFDSMADIGAAFASPEGQATAADVGNFATGGADMLMFDTKDV